MLGHDWGHIGMGTYIYQYRELQHVELATEQYFVLNESKVDFVEIQHLAFICSDSLTLFCLCVCVFLFSQICPF